MSSTVTGQASLPGAPKTYPAEANVHHFDEVDPAHLEKVDSASPIAQSIDEAIASADVGAEQGIKEGAKPLALRPEGDVLKADNLTTTAVQDEDHATGNTNQKLPHPKHSSEVDAKTSALIDLTL